MNNTALEESNLSISSLKNGSSEELNQTGGLYPYSMRPETYIVPIVFAVIFIIGILGNGTIITIFLKFKSMRNVPNLFILSMAVGDLLVIVFCIPFTSTLYTIESWPFGEFICKFSEFIKDMSIGISVFTLTGFSADRYFAIRNPLKKLRGHNNTTVSLVTIAGIWLLSVLMALPSAVFAYIRIIDDKPNYVFRVCYPFPPEFGDIYPKIIVIYRLLGYYLTPLLCIAGFYISMARHLFQSTQNIPGEAGGQSNLIIVRQKIAKMLLLLVVIFTICFLPQHVFYLWFYFHPNSKEDYNYFWHTLRIIGFCFGFFNSCVNPITLYCISEKFSKHFNQTLFRCCFEMESRTQVTLNQFTFRETTNRNILIQPSGQPRSGDSAVTIPKK